MAPPAAPKAGAVAGHGQEINALLSKLKENPEDIPSMNRLARILLRQQMFREAEIIGGRVLQLDAENIDAKVHSAMLTGAKGDAEAALAELTALVEKHPTHADAWFFRGMLGMHSQKSDIMKESFEKFVEHAPPSARKERIRGMLRGEGIKMPNQQ